MLTPPQIVIPHQVCQGSRTWNTLPHADPLCIHSGPLHLNIPASISSGAHEALDQLYQSVYGEDSSRCLIMQSELSLTISHVVRCASTLDPHKPMCLNPHIQTVPPGLPPGLTHPRHLPRHSDACQSPLACHSMHPMALGAGAHVPMSPTRGPQATC